MPMGSSSSRYAVPVSRSVSVGIFNDIIVLDNGDVSFWANYDLLPSISMKLQDCDEQELFDLGVSIGVFKRDRITEFKNSAGSITPAENGASVVVSSTFVKSASFSLTQTPNRACAKLGHEINNFHQDWKPRQIFQSNVETSKSKQLFQDRLLQSNYFICGANVVVGKATIMLSRELLLELADSTNHPMGKIFRSLAGILDESNNEVDADLDECTAAMDDTLISIESQTEQVVRETVNEN